jgi:hypothetical protein
MASANSLKQLKWLGVEVENEGSDFHSTINAMVIFNNETLVKVVIIV